MALSLSDLAKLSDKELVVSINNKVHSYLAHVEIGEELEEIFSLMDELYHRMILKPELDIFNKQVR